MPSLTRRRFLTYSSALLTVPLWAKAVQSAEPDVIVIGAGAAGIAAARTLLEAGRSVTVIEAAGRIGGRVHTNTSTFGVPYDIGAHWLHRAERNPFVAYGRDNGFSVYPAPNKEILFVGDREATGAEFDAMEAELSETYRAILEAGARGKDVSPASVISPGGTWGRLVHLLIGPFEMGKDFDHFSCKDWYNSEDGTDWFCKEGYGALWAHSAAGVPVELSTKASVIKWGGPGVTVETNRGTLRAKTCIVTVSTGVLANEALRFDPPLSARKQDSFQGISMGLYNHIALQFRENFFEIGDDGYVYYKIDEDVKGSPKGMGLLTNISGSTLSFGDVGGAFAKALEAEGKAAAIDFALSDLRKIYGGKVDQAFVKGSVTSWGKNPLTFGSYASAEPGAYPLRAVLREPVGERIWFAGEACSSLEWATVAGAHKNGIATAEDVLDHLQG